MSDTQYICTAPLVDVIVGADSNGEGGSLQRVHKGGGLPTQGLFQPQIDHLLERDMIASAEVTGGLEHAVIESARNAAEARRRSDVSDPDDPDDVDGGGPIPPKSASKSDWVAYAVSQRPEGTDEAAAQAAAEALTKEQLIEQYGKPAS